MHYTDYSDAYGSSFCYETFIRRAFKCDRDMKHGAHNSFLQNLIETEMNLSHTNKLASPDKQIEKIKSYLFKALDKYDTFPLTEAEREVFVRLRQDVTTAHTSIHIIDLCEEGVEVTQRFRDF